MTVPPAFARGVTLAGGGPFGADDLAAARARAPSLVAADGGADRLAALGAVPEAVIGDMDSLRGTLPDGVTAIPVTEQDSTDFAKCLRHVEAPLFIGVGFLGGRLDHTLAALSVLLEHAAKRIVLLGEEDVAAIVPPGRPLHLEPGARVSFYPLLPCTGIASEGLRWPVEGLNMAAGGTVGTSNEAASARVSARFGPNGIVTILPKRFLGAMVDALEDG